MISFHNGDLLTSGCDYICHQVNLQGCFGGGLALQIATKFPECERWYKKVISEEKHIELVGKCQICVDTCTRLRIVNCFTQRKNFKTCYSWIKQCFEGLRDLILHYCNKFRAITIGVPYKYGCGIATGDWNKVLKIFTQIFKNEKDIDFQIWKLQGE